MSKYTFIYKNNNGDRDCVKYAELDRIGKLECGHYFPQINFYGACYSGDLDEILENENVIDEIFEDITTILTKEDFKKLLEYNKKINVLGYGLDTQPQKQEEAKLYFKDIESIIEKLKSEENERLFEKVVEEEKEFLKYEYNLNDEDVENIFDAYYLDYKDRGIIGSIYEDYQELGEEEVDAFGYEIPEFIENFIDYEAFGEHLAENGNYYTLDDGRIVSFNY